MGDDRLEKRASLRKSLRTQGEISDAVSGGKKPIELLDISSGGISYLSASPFAKDSMWLVRFELNDRIVRGVIRIAYCTKHSLTDAYRIGAAFIDLEDRCQEVVNRYLVES